MNPQTILPTTTNREIDPSLRHLQAELARIDVLLRRQVRRWQLAGQDPADAFRGLYVSDAGAEALLARPFATSWGQTITLEPAEAQAFEHAQSEAARQAQLLAEAVRGQGHVPRLEYLAEAFGLDRFEMDALLVCLAPALDLRYEKLYGYLQDDVTRKRPTVNLVLDLLCEPGPERLPMLSRFADDAPLFKHHLLERIPESSPDRSPLLSQALSPDKTIVAWLLGKYQPHAELGSHATLLWGREDESASLLPEDMRSRLERAAHDQSLVVFYGPDLASQHAAAQFLAVRLQRPLLVVDMAAVTNAGVSPARALKLALRDTRLTGALACLEGWDACLVEGNAPPELLAELCAYPDVAVVAGRVAWLPAGIERDRRLVWLEFPIPSYSQRRALWANWLDQAAPLTNADMSLLAGQFLLSAGQIRDAAAAARDAAAQDSGIITSKDLLAAARAYSGSHLPALARKIAPRYDWQDMVLPDDQVALLREIIATVRGRPLVLDEWGVGKKLASSNGVTMLFAGPPGTGKTMAAEIIAGELGLDLYKIDLSTIVSKYIGETEKNLERIFSEAETSNAILFFDEADALFGKRSEVRDSHDRYANIEISYLLQRMEAYDGVTILATNLRANLDEAFTRRLQFIVNFPFPDEADRLRIWQALFPRDMPHDPALDFSWLARRYRLAGGNIRNIIVSAAYLAAADGGQVTMEQLLHGTRRELQKMGRLVGEKELTIDEVARG